MRSLFFLFALAAAALACSSSSTTPGAGSSTPENPAAPPDDPGATPPAPPSTPPATPPADPSAGCGKSATGAGAVTAKTLTAKGKSRTYHLSVPDGYDATKRYPLVFVLHGAGDENPENMKDWFAVEAAMPPSVFVYPQALNRTHADGSGGDIPRWDLDGDEDLLFFDAMVSEIGGAYCLDQSKVFATGFSSGGNFSHQLACLRQKSLRAVAPVEGPGPFVDTCDGPIAIWMTHDVNDDVLPVKDARDARDFWSTLDGCGNTWSPEPDNALCKRNTSCPAGKPVVYCETTGVGHNVADFAPATVGKFFSDLAK
jgi:poly(3-hydroxybutyrate) depolymerase